MKKKLLLLGFVAVLLVVIPISVFVAQKQQTTRSKAAPTTKLSFSPQTLSSTTGAVLKFDINIDPGSNQVSFVKLVINYDPTKLSAKTIDGLQENSQIFQSILEGPTYDETNNPATAIVSLSVGSDPASVITTLAKVGSMSFKALATTDADPTQITFNKDTTQALSIKSTDTASENVINVLQPASLSPAFVTIALGPNLTPTPTQTQTPTPTQALTPTPTSTQTTKTTSTGATTPTGQSASSSAAINQGTQVTAKVPQIPTETPEPTPSQATKGELPVVTIAPSGPTDSIFKLGGIAATLSIIGAFLFFVL